MYSTRAKRHFLVKIFKKTKKRENQIRFSRAEQGYVNYGALESSKNGHVFSGKYESGSKAFNKPHVICFANAPPDLESMSKDRWNVVHIQELIDAIPPV